MPGDTDHDVRSATETELLRAVSLGDIGRARALLGNQIDSSILSRALTSAAQTGTKELVTLFLDAGEDVNFRHNNLETPLVIAAEAGNMELVQVMLQHNPDEGGRQLALQRAIRKNRNFDLILELLQLLKDIKLEDNATGIDLLGIAADARYEEVVQYLLLNDISQIKPRSR
jgi:ankyrin repeat protein